MQFPNLPGLQNAYLGKFAQDLMFQTSEQMDVVYRSRGITIPVLLSSTLHFLAENKGASVADVSKGLGLQHQLVAQRIQKLLDMRLISKRKDRSDRRRTEYHLTSSGQEQADRLIACMTDTAVIYEELFAEIECDLVKALSKASSAIQGKSLSQRFDEIFPVGAAA